MGAKNYKQSIRYNEQGKTAEILSYNWENSDWELSSRYIYEYDAKGNVSKESYHSLVDSEWVPNYEFAYTYGTYSTPINETDSYYDNGQLTSQTYYEYNSSYNTTYIEQKEIRNGVMTTYEKRKIEYNSKNYQTHYENQRLDENGKWYYTEFSNQEYDSKGFIILSEDYDWDADKGKLFLVNGYYYEYDDNDFMTYYESLTWNGNSYGREFSKQTLNDNQLMAYSEYLLDNQNYYSHSIETYSYNDENLTGSSKLCDTTIFKDSDNEITSESIIDYQFNNKWLATSTTIYNVDTNTGERADMISETQKTYDSLNRELTIISNNYSNGNLSSAYKTENEYLDEKSSYIQEMYSQNIENGEWILESKNRFIEKQTGENSFYYQYSNWDMNTGEWVINNGYKKDYEGNENNYTILEYNWDTTANNWVITRGNKNIEEEDGENITNVFADYDSNNNKWDVIYSHKIEVTEGNPKVYREYYLQGNDLENWQLEEMKYYYYGTNVANETVSTMDARISTRPGTIHIDTEGKADLWIYRVNGACRHQSSIAGPAEISNLQEGIYIVVLKNASGTKKVKVLVR